MEDMSVIRVEIPEEVAERLASEAAERGTSSEDIAAEVLTRHIPEQATPYRVPRFVGKGHSGRHDLSERVEEILSAEFDA
jgi:plasmid stability protein